MTPYSALAELLRRRSPDPAGVRPSLNTAAQPLHQLMQEIPERPPYEGETQFFRERPDVTGMATEDDKITLNPFLSLSPEQQEAIRLNERLRVYMRGNPAPVFPLTPTQQHTFANYGTPTDIRDTIISRILSGDPSTDITTSLQEDAAQEIERRIRRKAFARGIQP